VLGNVFAGADTLLDSISDEAGLEVAVSNVDAWPPLIGILNEVPEDMFTDGDFSFDSFFNGPGLEVADSDMTAGPSIDISIGEVFEDTVCDDDISLASFSEELEVSGVSVWPKFEDVSDVSFVAGNILLDSLSDKPVLDISASCPLNRSFAEVGGDTFANAEVSFDSLPDEPGPEDPDVSVVVTCPSLDVPFGEVPGDSFEGGDSLSDEPRPDVAESDVPT